MSRTLKKIVFVVGMLLTIIVVLEILLQAGGLLVKNQAWRAKSQWLTGNMRVLALGDSNTYGLYLPEEDSYPSQLEKHWNLKRPDQPIEIINLGYPGTNSFRLLANMPEILDTFKPDVVLLMIGFNDFWTPVETPIAVKELSVIETLKVHSRLYKLCYMLLQKNKLPHEVDSGERALGGLSGVTFTSDDIVLLEQKSGMSLKEILAVVAEPDKHSQQAKKLEPILHEWVDTKNKNMAAKDILNTVRVEDKTFSLGIIEGKSAGNSKMMEQNLTSMLTLLDQRKIDVFLVNYPSNHGYYPAANRKIAKVANENQRHFIDLSATIPQPCRNHPDTCPQLFFYDGHATREGNRIISEKILSVLEQYWPSSQQLQTHP